MIRSKSRHNFVSKMNHDNIPKQAKSNLLGLNVNYNDINNDNNIRKQQQEEEEQQQQ